MTTLNTVYENRKVDIKASLGTTIYTQLRDEFKRVELLLGGLRARGNKVRYRLCCPILGWVSDGRGTTVKFGTLPIYRNSGQLNLKIYTAFWRPRDYKKQLATFMGHIDNIKALELEFDEFVTEDIYTNRYPTFKHPEFPCIDWFASMPYASASEVASFDE